MKRSLGHSYHGPDAGDFVASLFVLFLIGALVIKVLTYFGVI